MDKFRGYKKSKQQYRELRISADTLQQEIMCMLYGRIISYWNSDIHFRVSENNGQSFKGIRDLSNNTG